MILKLCFAFYILSQTVAAQNVRKYDVEQEAFRLYKQDFKSVLKRFRRTPDYLKILKDKLTELIISTKEMSLQVLHYYHGKMEKHVIDVLAGQAGNIKLDDEKDRNYFRTDDRADARPPHISEADWKKISELDKYNFFYSHLTVPERNTLKELGFSYAGQVIHSIVNNLKPVTTSEEEKESFTHPYEADTAKKTTTTTEHPENHQFKYVFDDDDDANKNAKPKENTEKTTPVEDLRFRASTSPARGNLTAARKYTRAPFKSNPASSSTRKVVTSIVTFKSQ